MQVIGFNFTKISTERELDVRKPAMNTNIEFTNVEKTKVELLNSDAIKFDFKYNITYQNEEKEEKKKKEEEKETNQAEIILEGNIIFSATPTEVKDAVKSWKKKTIPPQTQIPLYNLVLKKCTPHAVHLADQINLPSPVPFPKIKQNTQEQD